MRYLMPQAQLMHAGEEVFYVLIPVAVLYAIKERRARRVSHDEVTQAPPGEQQSMWTPRRILVTLVLFLVFAGLVILGALKAPPPGSSSGSRTVTGGLGTDLCSAYASAGDDPVRSSDIFRQRVHGPLHELAARASRANRAVAARLLEAKYAVESATGQYPPDPGRLRLALADLNRQVAVAYSSTGSRPPECLSPGTGR